MTYEHVLTDEAVGRVGRVPERRSARRTAARVTVAAAAVLVMSVGGGAAGALMLRGPGTPPAAPPAAVVSTEVARAETVALCSMFASAYTAMPDAQDNGRDLMPSLSAIMGALRDNPDADPAIRAAIDNEARLMWEKMGAFAAADGVQSKGAIRLPAVPWSAAELRANSGRTWDLCENWE